MTGLGTYAPNFIIMTTISSSFVRPWNGLIKETCVGRQTQYAPMTPWTKCMERCVCERRQTFTAILDKRDKSPDMIISAERKESLDGFVLVGQED